MASDEYVMLMSSLPALGPMLAAKFAPINPSRLQRRMKGLRPDHFREITEVADLLSWSRLALSETDAELVKKARRLMPTLTSPTLVELVRDRLELRTLIAALRRRHAGGDAPAPDVLWGYGRFVRRIRDNWREPGFGVERAFPWVLKAKDMLEKEDTAGLERLLLETVWRKASALASRHDFDFEAVALYLVRWNLLDRWTRYDADAAAARFKTMVEEALVDAPAALTEAL